MAVIDTWELEEGLRETTEMLGKALERLADFGHGFGIDGSDGAARLHYKMLQLIERMDEPAPEPEGDWDSEPGDGHDRYDHRWTCDAKVTLDGETMEYPGFLVIEANIHGDGGEFRTGTAENGNASINSHGEFFGQEYNTLEEAQLALEESCPGFKKKEVQ